MSRYVVQLNSAEAADPGRFGPKAANQAALGRTGMPIPDGFCIGADVYRAQLKAIGVEEAALAYYGAEYKQANEFANRVRLGLYTNGIDPEIREELLEARAGMVERTGALVVVRSSALVEDREGSTFAGQFESFLGLETEADFITSVKACWAALWAPRALRYMQTHDIDPGSTAMALLVQPLVDAVASGGGLSRTASGGMMVSATWGLGESIAQGEVVPDRYDLDADANIIGIATGAKKHSVSCRHHHAPHAHHNDHEHQEMQCLNEDQVGELAGYLQKSEDMLGVPAEIEWAMDKGGIKMLQARPLHMEDAIVPDAMWQKHPGLRGQPSGVGWGTGRAVVINCECEIGRIAPGDILVTNVAGPALAAVLPRVAGVVAELGGSTSHLASLGRERGIPMVLGVQDATEKIPDGSQVGVDGVAGIVRWVQ